MLKSKVMLFEYLIAISFALQVLLPAFFTPTTSILTFISLLVMKFKYEGIRVNTFIFILIQIGLILFSHPISNLIFTFLACWALSFFPVFEFPETKGPFRVGFKHLYLTKQIHASVFYPTLQAKTPKAPYKTIENGWARIYDIMRSYPNHFLPKVIYQIAFAFLDHLDIGVHLNANIIPKELLCHEGKFPAIVFSHGLSANRNLYTGFARQWASYGYIVFCIDHTEEVYVKFESWENYRQKRSVHLEERCQFISEVIDFIEDKKEIKNFFQDDEVEIDLEKISLAGHSFGSAAVIETARKEQRVKGALVLLDPWLFPASEQALETPAGKPVLILRSESFANVFKEFEVKEKIKKYVDANKEYFDQTISCYFQNTTHNSFCDFIVHMPREMQLFGIVQNPKEVEEIYNSQTMLTQIFLDLNLYSKTMFDVETKKSLVLKAFEHYTIKNSIKYRLEVDSF